MILEALTNFLGNLQGIWIVALMTSCGFIAGLIIHFIGDPGEMDLIVNNIRFKGGRLEPKNNLSMFLSSILCIASGGSAGPEAPLAQITGSTGSWVAEKLKLKGEALRSMSIAGMASGFTALFGAPLGSSLFAVEILQHKYVVEHYQALIPAFVASCSSYIVFTLIAHTGLGPTWTLPMYSPADIDSFFYAMLYAVIAAGVGWLFIYTVKLTKFSFKKIEIPVYIKMALGGLMLGGLALYVPITRYFSHVQLQELLTHTFPITLLVIILLVKILSVSITVTSGWRGGFIIPLFFIGATLGMIIYKIVPGQNLPLILVSCMAAINACVTRTPTSTIILLSTMTGFDHFIPIMFASLTGFFLAPRTTLIKSQMGELEEE